MMVAERVEEEDLPVHLHGSLILQQLLNFNKPIQVIMERPDIRRDSELSGRPDIRY